MQFNPNIRQSATPPSDVYTSEQVFEQLKEKLFARTWHWVADAADLRLNGSVIPFSLLEGCLNEPLLITRTEAGELHCLSNVCTHRGNLLVKHPGQFKTLVCGYHGRKFDLNGAFRFMPEFREAENFPSACDDLPSLPLHNWNGLLFTSLNPAVEFKDIVADMEQRVSWLPLHEFRFHSQYSQDYLVNANWMLYCDNYLEGFHIPYVHEGLNRMIDYQQYTTEIFRWSSLQLGLAKNGEDYFDQPPGSPDFGKKVAAYYFWLFPNMMFNFYPWGCSVNIVKPLSPSLTRVSFRTYIWKAEKYNTLAASMLERVEREDEDVVESVQLGVSSRLYNRGRYSPLREEGVHHFHSLLSEFTGLI